MHQTASEPLPNGFLSVLGDEERPIRRGETVTESYSEVKARLKGALDSAR